MSDETKRYDATKLQKELRHAWKEIQSAQARGDDEHAYFMSGVYNELLIELRAQSIDAEEGGLLI